MLRPARIPRLLVLTQITVVLRLLPLSTMCKRCGTDTSLLVLPVGHNVRSLVERVLMAPVRNGEPIYTALAPQLPDQPIAHQHLTAVLVAVVLLVMEDATHTPATTTAQMVATCLAAPVS